MKVFTELTTECDATAQLYANGYEKKEIASLKCRAIATINAQLQTAFKILNVKNGRELTMLMWKRIMEARFSISYDAKTRSLISACLLCAFLITFHHDFRTDMRRGRNVRLECKLKQ